MVGERADNSVAGSRQRREHADETKEKWLRDEHGDGVMAAPMGGERD